jgi:hypothetical protein
MWGIGGHRNGTDEPDSLINGKDRGKALAHPVTCFTEKARDGRHVKVHALQFFQLGKNGVRGAKHCQTAVT